MSKEQQHITSIGGQAVMEGVMMRGPFKTAVSVRKPDGEITTKVDENGTKTHAKIFKLPILRGCVNFVDSLVIGMKALMYSAEFVDLEEDDDEKSKAKMPCFFAMVIRYCIKYSIAVQPSSSFIIAVRVVWFIPALADISERVILSP